MKEGQKNYRTTPTRAKGDRRDLREKTEREVIHMVKDEKDGLLKTGWDEIESIHTTTDGLTC